MLPIYEYIDPAKYLTDALEDKKEKNPYFSLRSWAQQLGMKSHGPLHAMLKGQRNIPKKYIPLIIKSLKLSAKEAKFFELLVDYSRAKSIEEKDFYHEKLQALSPKELREVNDIEAYKYITEPLHIIIAEMAELNVFKNSVGWIKGRLRPHINLKDAEEIIERLINLEILKKEGNKLKKQIQHIYTSKEVMSKAVQLYHKKMGALAIEQISEQSIDEREFNAISFNIKKKDLPKIKEFIREFSDQMVQNFEAKSGEGEETYHLNVQFFSLTK
jgi:uncharacterized protein (TIGR02147 family)